MIDNVNLEKYQALIMSKIIIFQPSLYLEMDALAVHSYAFTVGLEMYQDRVQEVMIQAKAMGRKYNQYRKEKEILFSGFGPCYHTQTTRRIW